jgi:hypothetical protein
MSQRRILVIGSQCKALGRLTFLPQLAQGLYAVMTNPDRGGCVSALEGDGLLIDPTVKETKAAIRSAYLRAAKDEATLFIAYIGHGEKSENSEDYYLLPLDAENPPDSDTAVHLVNLLKETHRRAPGKVDGLGALVDACYSGAAGFGAAQAWVSKLKGTLRFEMLTAAADRPAADGCFSRTLIKLLYAGISEVPLEHLPCSRLRPLIERSCPNQVPQHPSYNPDETLWLARNAALVSEPWAKTPVADEIQRLTLSYQPTPTLREVVKRSNEQRCLVLLAEAGAGKSALATAMAWRKATEAIVPVGFVQAIALFTEATTPQELARAVGEQLVRAVPGFQKAQHAFARETPLVEQQGLGALERQVVEPLKRLDPAGEVRLVLDGLDRVATGALGSIMAAIDELAQLDFMRLLITARPDTVLPKAASIYSLPRVADEDVIQYLDRRGIPEIRRAEVARAAQGNWLVARVLADLICDREDVEIRAEGQLALGDAYEELLLRCGAAADSATQRVLEVLAAAGAGPLLPFSILCTASKAIDGPATPAAVRDHLVRLSGLAVRSAAGTEREHDGLFHETLVQHIAAHARDLNRRAHRAIIISIDVLAPIGSGSVDLGNPGQHCDFEREAEILWVPVDLSNPSQHYAFEREAEHLWALGETESAVKRLSARTSPAPRDNLRRSRLWLSRVEEAFGPDHLNTLWIRDNIANWTGECGDAPEALQLLKGLLPDYERVLGPDHTNTLRTRLTIAHWTGECQGAPEALRLFKALLPDYDRVLGPDHLRTLTTRHGIAYRTGQCGDAPEALRLFKALLPDHERVLGPDHPETLSTRLTLVHWIGQCGDAPEALRLFKALLPDQERVLGPDHPKTLVTRSNIAGWTGLCGDAPEALRLFKALLPDQERVLAPGHPNTLWIRVNIAHWTGECLGAPEALRLLKGLLPDQERVLGPDHTNILRTRGNIAHWTGRCGDAPEALRLFKALLPDYERVLGPDHPNTLTVRASVASLTGEPDHTNILRTCAHWTGESGDAPEALRLLE